MRCHMFLSRTSGTLQAELTACIIIVERSVGEMAYGAFKQHCFCCCCCFLMHDLWLQTMHGSVLSPPPSPEKNAFVRLKASDKSGLVAAVNPRQLRWHIDSLIGATGRRQTPHSPLCGLSLIHKLRPRGGKKGSGFSSLPPERPDRVGRLAKPQPVCQQGSRSRLYCHTDNHPR